MGKKSGKAKRKESGTIIISKGGINMVDGRIKNKKEMLALYGITEGNIKAYIEKIEKENGKQGVMKFVVSLCEMNDRDMFEGEDITYDLLVRLNDILGIRLYYYEQYRKTNRESITTFEDKMYCDYKEWKNEMIKSGEKDKKITVNRFYEKVACIAKKEETGIKYIDKYNCARSTVLKVLYGRINNEEIPIELGHVEEFPYIEEYDIIYLKRFAYDLTIAYFCKMLTERLEEYIDKIKNKKKSHKNKTTLEGKMVFPLFEDVQGINISIEEINKTGKNVENLFE